MSKQGASLTMVVIMIVLVLVAAVGGYFAGSMGAPSSVITITTTGYAGATGTVTRIVTQPLTIVQTQTLTRTVTQPTTATPQFELHAAYVTAPSEYDTHHYFFTRFKEKVEARTNGRVKIVLHPGGELGNQVDYLEMMKAGTLFMATIEVSQFVQFTDKFLFFSFPGLFRTTEEAQAFGEAPETLKYANEVAGPLGWIVPAITVGGARYFLTVPEKPIKSIDDFKGLKIRVMPNPIFVEALQTLGALPTPLPYTEVFTALQTKTIDGMENEVAAIIAMRFYEVAPNIALFGWCYAWHWVVLSKQLFEKLPSDIQQIILEAITETAKEKNAWGLYVERVVGLQVLMSRGAKIYSFDTTPGFSKLATWLETKKAQIPAFVMEWLSKYRSSFGG
ncbi:MAG: TRAP transporter substrate-binding protein [Desulfurococcaceae archaeon]